MSYFFGLRGLLFANFMRIYTVCGYASRGLILFDSYYFLIFFHCLILPQLGKLGMLKFASLFHRPEAMQAALQGSSVSSTETEDASAGDWFHAEAGEWVIFAGFIGKLIWIYIGLYGSICFYDLYGLLGSIEWQLDDIGCYLLVGRFSGTFTPGYNELRVVLGVQLWFKRVSCLCFLGEVQFGFPFLGFDSYF